MSVFDCNLSLVNSSAALSSDSSVLVADFSKSSRTTCQRSANCGMFQKLGRWSNFWIDLNVTGVAALSEVRAKKGLQHWDHTIGLFLFATIASFKTCFWILGRKHAKTLDAACLYNWKNGSPIETLLVWTATLKHWLRRSVQLSIDTLLSLGISTYLSPFKSVRSPRQSAPKLLHSCHDW